MNVRDKVRMTHPDSFWYGKIGDVYDCTPGSRFVGVRFAGGIKGYTDVSVLREHVTLLSETEQAVRHYGPSRETPEYGLAVDIGSGASVEYEVPIENRDDPLDIPVKGFDAKRFLDGLRAGHARIEEEPDLTFIGIEEYEFEQRITDAGTGGQKGRKLARFALVPWQAARALARHYGIGALKYEDDNWRKGYDWDLSIDALERHFNAFKGGESIYVEEFTGRDGRRYEVETHHLIAVAWQAFTLYIFERLGLGRDTRQKRDTA